MSDSPSPRHAFPDTGPQAVPDGDIADTAEMSQPQVDQPDAEPSSAADPEKADPESAEPGSVEPGSAEPGPDEEPAEAQAANEPPADAESTAALEPVGARAWSAAETAEMPVSTDGSGPATAASPTVALPSLDTSITEKPSTDIAATEKSAPPPPPALRAEGLGVTVHGRRVFAGFDVLVRPHSVLVVAAPSGTGRSTLLLTLTGRFRPTAGRLAVAGVTDPARIRQLTAVARIGSVVEPEPWLTVGQAIVERALLDGVPTAAGEAAVSRAATVLDFALDRDRLVEALPADKRTLLAVALACSRPAELIVLDDLDDRLDVASQARILDRLGALAAEGPAVVVSTTQPLRLPPWATGVTLLPPAVGVPSPPDVKPQRNAPATTGSADTAGRGTAEASTGGTQR